MTRITERENRTGPASATLGGPEAATLCILSAHGPLVARIASLVPGLTVIGIVPDSLALDRLVELGPALVCIDLESECTPSTETERLDLLEQVALRQPDCRLIALVGEGRRDLAALAIGRGAVDFYHLPIDPLVLPLIFNRVARLRELERENRALKAIGRSSMNGSGIIGTSPAIVETFRRIEKVAPTDATVLIQGDSGTGKELFARALHRLSHRSERTFFALNCAAIPEPLLESELFGHEKGAFTGAVRQAIGKLESASGGTVFLDEIGEMTPGLQAKLLRVIQERVIERVGGRVSIPLDIRIICATHRDLHAMIAAKTFREDLYYRISTVTVAVPPVRERGDDALLLARHFLADAARSHHKSIRGFSADAIRAIADHVWSGNVREIENRVVSAVIMTDGRWLNAEDLGLRCEIPPRPQSLRETRREAELGAIRRAIAASDGNLTKAARMLEITRPTLYDLIGRYAIGAASAAPTATIESERT